MSLSTSFAKGNWPIYLHGAFLVASCLSHEKVAFYARVGSLFSAFAILAQKQSLQNQLASLEQDFEILYQQASILQKNHWTLYQQIDTLTGKNIQLKNWIDVQIQRIRNYLQKPCNSQTISLKYEATN
jgi:hypothetical protein